MDTIAASYARRSSEHGDSTSLGTQTDRNRAYAAEAGLTLGYEFAEEFTGTVRDRPELNKLRRLIRERKINAVIIYATDRLARDTGVASLLLDEFVEAGVDLHVVAWGGPYKKSPEDRLRFNFEASFSTFERDKIAERTLRGKRARTQAGVWPGNGRVMYGYDRTGHRSERKLVVNERQADVVRSIYHWYTVEHLSVKGIVGRLRGTPSPADENSTAGRPKIRAIGEWTETYIYRVLRDESYTGRYIAFRSSSPIVVPIPAIITEEAWNAAQTRLNVGRQQSKRGTKYNYLLARRLKCPCGCSLQASSGTGSSGRPHLYYRCTSSASNVAAAPCGMRPLQARVVDSAVWRRVKELLKDPESLDLLLVEAQNADLREDMVRIDRSIARVEENLRRSAQAYDLANANDQAYSKALFARDMASAEEQLKSLAVERNKTSARLASASISTEYRDRVRALAERVKDRLEAATFEQCVEVVSELDMSARLVLGGEGLRLRLYLFSHEVGALWADLPKS